MEEHSGTYGEGIQRMSSSQGTVVSFYSLISIEMQHPSTHPPRERQTQPVNDEPEEEDDREEGFEF